MSPKYQRMLWNLSHGVRLTWMERFMNIIRWRAQSLIRQPPIAENHFGNYISSVTPLTYLFRSLIIVTEQEAIFHDGIMYENSMDRVKTLSSRRKLLYEPSLLPNAPFLKRIITILGIFCSRPKLQKQGTRPTIHSSWNLVSYITSCRVLSQPH